MTAPDTLVAEYQTGSGRMTVTEDPSGYAYVFRITGRTNSVAIDADEAAELAAILSKKSQR